MKRKATGVTRHLHGEGAHRADTGLFLRACLESLEAPFPAASIDPDCSSQGSINPPHFFPGRGHGGFLSMVYVFVIKTF